MMAPKRCDDYVKDTIIESNSQLGANINVQLPRCDDYVKDTIIESNSQQ